MKQDNITISTNCTVLLFLLLGMISISKAAIQEVDDRFLAGYATAVLERDLGLITPSLKIQDGVITLNADDLQGANPDKVVEILTPLRGVRQVQIVEEPVGQGPGTELVTAATAPAKEEPSPAEEKTVILPRRALFDPLLADLRWPHFSAAYRYYDNDPELSHVFGASFGETFQLLRRETSFGGQWGLDIQGGVFAIFDLDSSSFDFINSDFLVGLPVTYRYANLSAQARLFHQSSHLGDEFLLRDRVDRVNLSFEGVDLLISYDLGTRFRIYAGGGFLFRREPSDLDPGLAQLGLEYRGQPTFFEGQVRPLVALDLKSQEENNWDTDVSLRMGFQFENPQQQDRQLQLLLEFFEGRNPNGQFFERDLRFFGIGVHTYF